jgi:hypothetical protein
LEIHGFQVISNQVYKVYMVHALCVMWGSGLGVVGLWVIMDNGYILIMVIMGIEVKYYKVTLYRLGILDLRVTRDCV